MTTSVREIVGTDPGRPRPPVTPRREGRARARRILYLVGLLPLVVALAFFVKVVVMRHHDDAGADAWQRQDGASALEQYDANRSLNLLERWIAPFDSGDAAFELADYPHAKDLFLTALRTVPQKQECTVRINLALTDEAIGDAAARKGATDDARAAWQDGIKALDDGGCPRHAGLGQQQTKDAATVKQRLEDKLKQSSQPQQSQQQNQQHQPQPSPEERNKLDKLKQHNDRGSHERKDYHDLDDYPGFGDQPQW